MSVCLLSISHSIVSRKKEQRKINIPFLYTDLYQFKFCSEFLDVITFKYLYVCHNTEKGKFPRIIEITLSYLISDNQLF